ncbi:hypothetical protein JDV02_001106 [Purpureocillium takamizusanense]|uniref:Uncharacterized protein n=1 Tax=Purpureocillium takamizusanense TaxID=2060973 RepID=A0A9Q8V7I3_9HYPO|nr:uncharacterized protein JDV02_001106 [Purpureocillium takamizusanense]UNI14481.1 hypothetical protein JDV02_001106 [Purpureocillium takamizusanense]
MGGVQELDTEDEDGAAARGLGLSARRNTRFVSDSLRFTGIDLGDRTSGTLRRRRLGDSEETDEDGSSSSRSDDIGDDDSAYGEEPAPLAIEDREESLVQSALRRISKAQAKGKADVKLSKEELGALERRRKRMQEEEERRRQASSSGGDRKKKKKEQRVAVPLSQLEPISRKKTTKAPPQSQPPPRHASAGDLPQGHGYPPAGFFPPPSSSRPRPRSGTTSSRPPSRAHDERGSSPFQYEYVPRTSSSNRHISDSVARPRSSRGSPRMEPLVLGARSNLDPFQFQTAGPRAAYAASAVGSSRRYVSGPAEMMYDSHRRRSAAPGSSLHASHRKSYGDETSEESQGSEDSSDDRGNAAHVGEHSGRRGDADIVVEVSPEPEPEPPPPLPPVTKKKSSSPVKKKSSSGSRRKRR